MTQSGVPNWYPKFAPPYGEYPMIMEQFQTVPVVWLDFAYQPYEGWISREGAFPEEHVRLCSHLQHSYTKAARIAFTQVDGQLIACKGFGVVEA